jgi:hypothetical protein
MPTNITIFMRHRWRSTAIGYRGRQHDPKRTELGHVGGFAVAPSDFVGSVAQADLEAAGQHIGSPNAGIRVMNGTVSPRGGRPVNGCLDSFVALRGCRRRAQSDQTDKAQ